MEQFFASCPRGLEAVLAAELGALGALGAAGIAPADGGVAFSGEFTLCYVANLESRTASRILWQVGHCGYRTEQDIFEAARALPWARWFDVRYSIRVSVAAIRSPLKSLDFITLRIKDAVCDAFRAARGRRPDVDTAAPQIRIHAFLTRNEATFYLDTSGEALFKRGWRVAAGEAPLRENLAAGIIKLAGWHPEVPLFDPMCGSGTFLIEAAMMGLDIAPGLGREFGFERLSNFDPTASRKLRERVQEKPRQDRRLSIHGSDKLGNTLRLARENLAATGLAEVVALKQMDILDSSPPAASGIVVMNPPYGERLAGREELAAFYPKLGDVLKQRYAGWTACILSADMQLAKLIGLKASRRTPLYNGALECRLFEYRLVAGSMRRGGTPPDAGTGSVGRKQ